MRRIIWVALTLSMSSCAGNPNYDPSPAEPTYPISRSDEAADDTVTTEPIHEDIGGGIKATYCPIKRPFRSWEDYESQSSLCERLGRAVGTCEVPSTSTEPDQICQDLDRMSDRAAVVEAECMTWKLDPERTPVLIRGLLRCVRGPLYEQGHHMSIPCPTQMACIRDAGIQWTPLTTSSGTP